VPNFPLGLPLGSPRGEDGTRFGAALVGERDEGSGQDLGRLPF
jgi:hypothetical protein